MECGQVEKLLSEYLEEALPPKEIALIKDHLITCARCRTALAEYRKTEELLKGLGEVEPPPGFAQEIMTRIRAETGDRGGLLKKLFYPLHVKVPIQAIATVVIAVLAIQVYRSVEPERVPVQAPVVSTPVPPKEEPALEEKREGSPSAAPASPRAQDDIRMNKKRHLQDKKTEPIPATAAPFKSQSQENKMDTNPSEELKKREAAREEERSRASLASVQARRELQGAAPSPPAAMPLPEKTETIRVRIRVDDIVTAGQAVMTLLQDFGGGRVERTPGEGSEIITASLQTRRVQELIEKLGAVGEAEEKPHLPGIPGEIVGVRIEILKK